jgi:sirohydrochlorin cobaltochelatase
MTRPSILLCGHGSRDREAGEEFSRVAAALARRLPEHRVAAAYLEFARPTIREGLDRLRDEGAMALLAVPCMLFAAGHVKNDLPSELNSFAADNPELGIAFARDLTIDAKLLNAAADRIKAALGDAPAAESLLLVVGRGTSDPDANGNIAKLARLLSEGLGFGWSEIAFSGVAEPRVGAALDRAVRLGFSRIIVFPYFLFTGVLVKRIYAETDKAQGRHSDVVMVKAEYLGDHPLVIETLADRVEEVGRGENAMNCQLCKYRERMPGYEADVARPQAGNHHHVRGIGTDADHGAAHPHPHAHGRHDD